MFRRVKKGDTDVSNSGASSTVIAGSPASKTKGKARRKSGRHHHNQPSSEGASVFGLVTLVASVILIACGMVLGLLFCLVSGNPAGQQPAGKEAPNTPLVASPNFPVEYPKIFWDGTGSHKEHVQLSEAAIDMCTNTLWHTVETTTIVLPDEETFIHTGDIDDLWVRDSAAQIHPLVAPLLLSPTITANEASFALIQRDQRLDRIVRGLIKRCAMYIRHDPYANAFRIDDTYVFSAQQKLLGRHDLISTWNYELDSACYYFRLLYFYWKAKPQADVLRLPRVKEAVSIMVDLWTAEQLHEVDAFPTGPLFDCQNCNKPYRYPELKRDGKGTRTNPSSGLTWTGFRPSDDACEYGFLIPANMFAVAALEYIIEMNQHLWKDADLKKRATKLKDAIQVGIETFGVVNHGKYGQIYAFEVDGFGNYNLMDDANIPSLLSIPYLGYTHYDTQVYDNTKRFIFSNDNPTFRKGDNALTGHIEGYGSSHMVSAIRDNIWPMAIAMKGLVSNDIHEKVEIVELLVKASAGKGWMHESFDVTNPQRYTRGHFCWADSLFAELVLSLTDECPKKDRKYKVMEWRDPIVPPGGEYAITNQPITQK